jgi:hypothetical protein
MTPLHLAVSRKKEIARMLLNHERIDLRIPDSKGHRPDLQRFRLNGAKAKKKNAPRH